MIQRRHILVMVLGLCAVVVGCESGDKEKIRVASGEQEAAARAAVASHTLIPQAYPPVEDVPVPMGFKLVEAMSKGIESAETREIDHTYQGRADRLSIERFYDAQMPIKGWTRREKELEDGEFTLTFDKADESAVVHIESAPTYEGERTSVNVKIEKH